MLEATLMNLNFMGTNEGLQVVALACYKGNSGHGVGNTLEEDRLRIDT